MYIRPDRPKATAIDGTDTFINLDLAQSIVRSGNETVIRFGDGEEIRIKDTPNDLMISPPLRAGS
jgi:hypothetical protein